MDCLHKHLINLVMEAITMLKECGLCGYRKSVSKNIRRCPRCGNGSFKPLTKKKASNSDRNVHPKLTKQHTNNH